MTPAAYRAALEALDWAPGRLARLLGCHRNLPLAWASGRASVPTAVADWLATLARAHAAHPPPDDWRVRS